MQRHVHTINPDGTFTYAGDMDKGQAIQLFNELMQSGIRVDVEPGLKTLVASGHARNRDLDKFRATVKRAFDSKNKLYGNMVFSLLCDGRITGQRNQDGQFNA